MKENKYDDINFFQQYSKMARSVKGLQGAGEWHMLKNMLPDFAGKRVLDLGAGFGWHCMYAVENGAVKVTGVDISEKMLEIARIKNNSHLIEYQCVDIEDFNFEPDTYDVVISSLALHYLKSFEDICSKIYNCLSENGAFVFSVEHPVFTAYGNQDWYYDDGGNCLHWPVDRYFYEGERQAVFLGSNVVKYHKTLTTYINGLLKSGFVIKELLEAKPDEVMLKEMPEMINELRRPMMLLISAVKK